MEDEYHSVLYGWLNKVDLSFLDDVPDDINSAEDFEKNIAALKKYKELLDEADKDKINWA